MWGKHHLIPLGVLSVLEDLSYRVVRLLPSGLTDAQTMRKYSPERRLFGPDRRLSLKCIEVNAPGFLILISRSTAAVSQVTFFSGAALDREFP